MPKTGEAKTAEKAAEPAAGHVSGKIEKEKIVVTGSFEPGTEKMSGAALAAAAEPVNKKRDAPKKAATAKIRKKEGGSLNHRIQSDIISLKCCE